MATAAGIWNHPRTAGPALTGNSALPMAQAATGGTSSSSTDSATISANDFLTLLVTEMQNQDPTADTDPNEYINQLVQVNSLEQLIDINQTLTTDLGSSTSSSGSSSSGPAGASKAGAIAQARAVLQTGGGLPGFSPAVARATHSGATAARSAPGNLSVPETKPAAQRVAHALDGRTAAQPLPDGLSAAQ
jgi:flagellar basal-body rod modification protein FlgD